MRKGGRRTWLIRTLVALAVLGLCWVGGTEVGGVLGFRPPLLLCEPQYRSIVAAVRSGLARPNGQGTVQLPWGIGSPDGRVFVERKPDGRLFVLFPTWYGRGDDLQGYLWCSRPLRHEDGEDVNWGSGGTDHEYDLCGQSNLQAEHVRGAWWWVFRRID